MAKATKIIEFDVDGVLLDIGTAVCKSGYGEAMRQANLTFESTGYFDFRDFPQDVRAMIFAAFSDKAVISTLQPYYGVSTMLTSLNLALVRRSGFSVLFRSGITSENVRAEKQARIEKLLYDTVGIFNPYFNFELVSVVADEYDKKDITPFILIEDNADRIVQSKAPCKILVNHSYNQESNYPQLQGISYTRAKTPAEILNAILGYMNSAV